MVSPRLAAGLAMEFYQGKEGIKEGVETWNLIETIGLSGHQHMIIVKQKSLAGHQHLIIMALESRDWLVTTET